jgi:inosine-uridine nucleoside N-ribohydrolase
VARVARPQLVECREAYVEVELSGRLTSGTTVTDFAKNKGRPFNAKVGTGLAVDGFWNLFVDAVSVIGR